MKTEIKNFLKSNLLGLISLILILSGGVYAKTWTTGSVVTAADFQALRDQAFGGSSCPGTWEEKTLYTIRSGNGRDHIYYSTTPGWYCIK